MKVKVTYYDADSYTVEQIVFRVEAITISDYSFSFIVEGETEVVTIKWSEIPAASMLSFIQ